MVRFSTLPLEWPPQTWRFTLSISKQVGLFQHGLTFQVLFSQTIDIVNATVNEGGEDPERSRIDTFTKGDKVFIIGFTAVKMSLFTLYFPMYRTSTITISTLSCVGRLFFVRVGS